MSVMRSRQVCLAGALLVGAGLVAGGRGSAAPVKIGVRQTGLYWVTGAQLAAAGVGPSEVQAERIGLSCQGQAVAHRVTGLEDGRFAEGSAIIFYGEALDTRYADTNVYWLRWDGEPGSTMEALGLTEDAGPPIESAMATVRFEENHQYLYLIWAPDVLTASPWVWMTIGAGESGKMEFDLPHAAAGKGATVRVMLRGRSSKAEIEPDHHAVIELNGQRIGEAKFDAQAACLIPMEAPAEAIKPGGNVLTVSVPGDTAAKAEDRLCLDWVEVEYARELQGNERGLTFDLPAGAKGTVTAGIMTAPSADVYDLTSAAKPLVAAGLAAKDGKVEFGVGEGGPRRFAVVTDEGYLTPSAITTASEPDLRAAGNGADYLIVAHESLLKATRPLAEYRESQGLKVRLVGVTQVYDEFSGGVFTPQAIADFVAYTQANWQPKPQYLLLVGDATYDYRDYLGTGFANQVPSMIAREAGGVEVASDAAYAVGEEGRPAMAVGRLPVKTPEEVAALVRRTIEYERRGGAGEAKKVLLIADQEGFGGASGTFSAACDRLGEEVKQAGSSVEKLYQTEVGLKEQETPEERVRRTKEALTRKIIEGLKGGPLAVFYLGHGDEYYWGYNKLLAVDDLTGVSFERPAGLIVEDTCFAGAFDCPGGDEDLSEALLRSGACVACYAPTRLGGADVQEELIRRLVAGAPAPIGKLILELRGKRVLRNPDGSWATGIGFNLLGDPALTVR